METLILSLDGRNEVFPVKVRRGSEESFDFVLVDQNSAVVSFLYNQVDLILKKPDGKITFRTIYNKNTLASGLLDNESNGWNGIINLTANDTATLGRTIGELVFRFHGETVSTGQFYIDTTESTISVNSCNDYNDYLSIMTENCRLRTYDEIYNKNHDMSMARFKELVDKMNQLQKDINSLYRSVDTFKNDVDSYLVGENSQLTFDEIKKNIFLHEVKNMNIFTQYSEPEVKKGIWFQTCLDLSEVEIRKVDSFPLETEDISMIKKFDVNNIIGNLSISKMLSNGMFPFSYTDENTYCFISYDGAGTVVLLKSSTAINGNKVISYSGGAYGAIGVNASDAFLNDDNKAMLAFNRNYNENIFTLVNPIDSDYNTEYYLRVGCISCTNIENNFFRIRGYARPKKIDVAGFSQGFIEMLSNGLFTMEVFSTKVEITLIKDINDLYSADEEASQNLTEQINTLFNGKEIKIHSMCGIKSCVYFVYEEIETNEFHFIKINTEYVTVSELTPTYDTDIPISNDFFKQTNKTAHLAYWKEHIVFIDSSCIYLYSISKNTIVKKENIITTLQSSSEISEYYASTQEDILLLWVKTLTEEEFIFEFHLDSIKNKGIIYFIENDKNGAYYTELISSSVSVAGDNTLFNTGLDDVCLIVDNNQRKTKENSSIYYGNGSQWLKM